MDQHRPIPVELEEIELADFREGRRHPATISREQPPWLNVSLRDLLQFDVTMENTGSVAREHLANERTMLSWIRAAAQLLFIGVGFFQYLKFDYVELDLTTREEDLVLRLVRPVGAMCILIAAMVLVFGVVRHYRVQLYLLRNWFPAAKFTIVLLLVGCLVMGIVVATLEAKLIIR